MRVVRALRDWWSAAVEPRLTWRVRAILSLALTAVILSWIVLYIDPATLIRRIRSASLDFVVLGALVHLASWGVRGLRYRDILAEMGYDLGVAYLTGILFVTQVANVLFPARTGDAIRAYFVKTQGVPYTSGFASVTAERIFDFSVVTVIGGSVFVALLWTGMTTLGVFSGPDGPGGFVLIALFTGTAVFLVVLVLIGVAVAAPDVTSRLPSIAGLVPRAGEVIRTLRRFAADLHKLVANPLTGIRVTAASVLIWGLDSLTAALVFEAFGVSLEPRLLAMVCLLGVSVGALAKVVPLSPGGIGPYETAFAVVIVGTTPIGWSLALTLAVVDHALKNAVTVMGGAAGMAALNLSLILAVRESDEIDTDPEADPRDLGDG